MNKIQHSTISNISLWLLLLTSFACVENGNLENIDQGCFTKESLQTVPWIVDELKNYTDPMGYHAGVYLYNGEQFLAISHPLDCTPIGHVFNCSGVPLDSLGIDQNDFSRNRRLVVTLAEIKI